MLKKTFLFLLLLPLIAFTPGKPAKAEKIQTETSQSMTLEARTLDPRAQVLRDYLAQYNSPLQYHAQDFVDAADTYGVDWKLVPAITGTESTFGKFVPGGTEPGYTSYNGWGWGVYGNQAIYFDSWRDGIFTVTKGLKERYISKGLTDPYAMNKVYAASPTWGSHVSYFLNDIEKFTNGYQFKESSVKHVSVDTKTAGTSATLKPDQLALKQ